MTIPRAWSVVAGLLGAVCVLLAGGHPGAASEPPGGGDIFARLSADIIAETLLADEAPALRPPPWLTAGRVASERGVASHATAVWILLNDEMGATDRFAGTGSGVEVRIDVARPSGWGASLMFASIDRGVYSIADDKSVVVERYMLGVSRAPGPDRRWGVSPGAGLAWNALDIQSDDPALDIDGAGGYAELRAVGRLGRRLRIELASRAIYWRGRDGLGGSGDELSIILGVGMGLRF